jgi:hypothetical protein
VDKETSRELENRLALLGQAFRYPPTPDLSEAVRIKLASPRARRARPRLGWAIALGIVLLAVVLAVPPVRAQIIEFIQVGVVRIFSPDPPPGAPAAVETEAPAHPEPGSRSVPEPDEGRSEATDPVVEPEPPSEPASFPEFSGETTLEAAQAALDFPISLPAYPDDLGLPDRVFLQEVEGQMAVLVWLAPGRAEEALLSLHIIGPDDVVILKYMQSGVLEAEVNGQEAYWTTGRYVVELKDGSQTLTRLIDGHVLIWTEGELTYRLETGLSLEEAVRVAESLRPVE